MFLPGIINPVAGGLVKTGHVLLASGRAGDELKLVCLWCIVIMLWAYILGTKAYRRRL